MGETVQFVLNLLAQHVPLGVSYVNYQLCKEDVYHTQFGPVFSAKITKTIKPVPSAQQEEMKESVMMAQGGALGGALWGALGNGLKSKMMEGLKLSMIAKVSDVRKAKNLERID